MSFWMSLFHAHRHSRFTFSSLLFLSLVFFLTDMVEKIWEIAIQFCVENNFSCCHGCWCQFTLSDVVFDIFFICHVFSLHLTANNIEVSPRICKQRRNKDQESRYEQRKKKRIWDKCEFMKRADENVAQTFWELCKNSRKTQTYPLPGHFFFC